MNLKTAVAKRKEVFVVSHSHVEQKPSVLSHHSGRDVGIQRPGPANSGLPLSQNKHLCNLLVTVQAKDLGILAGMTGFSAKLRIAGLW